MFVNRLIQRVAASLVLALVAMLGAWAPPPNADAESGPACADIIGGGAEANPTLTINIILARGSCPAFSYRIVAERVSLEDVVATVDGDGSPWLDFRLEGVDPLTVACVYAESLIDGVVHDRAPDTGCSLLVAALGLAPHGDYDPALRPCHDVRLARGTYGPSEPGPDGVPRLTIEGELWREPCGSTVIALKVWRPSAGPDPVLLNRRVALNGERSWRTRLRITGGGAGAVCFRVRSLVAGVVRDQRRRCVDWNPDVPNTGGRGFNWY